MTPLESYTRAGYTPNAGVVVEALNSKMGSWETCVVANTYTVLQDVDEDETFTAMATLVRDGTLQQGADPDEVRLCM